VSGLAHGSLIYDPCSFSGGRAPFGKIQLSKFFPDAFQPRAFVLPRSDRPHRDDIEFRDPRHVKLSREGFLNELQSVVRRPYRLATAAADVEIILQSTVLRSRRPKFRIRSSLQRKRSRKCPVGLRFNGMRMCGNFAEVYVPSSRPSNSASRASGGSEENLEMRKRMYDSVDALGRMDFDSTRRGLSCTR